LSKKKRKGGKTPPKRKQKNNRKLIAISLIALLGVVAVVYALSSLRGSSAPPTAPPGTEVTTASGLKYIDAVVGGGNSPSLGRMVSVHYTGTLENGTKFDSSYDRGQPHSFPIGMGRVIKGWDEGLMTMKEGGKRRLIIPPNLGYGPSGSPPKIPGNATLIFEVELLKVQ
jgi:FKBP-type peptidyl-prolyl cis-trans isomerase